MDFSVMALSVICGLNVYLLILRASDFKDIFDSLCTYSSLDHPFYRILLTLYVLSHTIVIRSRDFHGLLTNLLICRSFVT